MKRRLRNLYYKENFKPEIKPKIENLKNKLYQLENKQAKGGKLCTNIRWDLEGRKCSKTFFKVLERQNMQNQTLSELYTDDNKSKYSTNLKDIFKSEKKSYEKLYTKETTSIATTIEFPSNILIRKKISNEKVNLFVAKISLYEIMKSITFQTNNKSPGSASRIAELYKHLSNELSPVLLDI